MSIATGTRLGPYEVIASLGAGGMGEVYRARDTKLGRSVAIKVIAAPFAADTERVARFDREAKVLASLNHANIAALFGMEEADHQLLLIMELVEGETLAERIARGAIAIEEALPIARQIAEALEAAHERGVVHRDLKPANVKITPDDKVKVLDFGLAKAMETAPASANVTNSPTLSMMASQAGIVLGTAAYMSPEQAKGLPVDQRSDIFSFGVVLYEMLTGRQPFRGETVPDILASVLAREPELAHLPSDLNPRVVELLRRCLDKTPKKRWQAIGDVRQELEIVAASPRASTVGTIAAPRLPLWRRAIPVAAAIILTAAITSAGWWLASRPSPAPIVRFAQMLQEGQIFGGTARSMLAISSDGTKIAFSLGESGAGLYVRNIDAIDARLVTGTSGYGTPNSPAFSPDGQWLVFWTPADTALKKVAISGGTATTLARTEIPRGISWDGDWIVLGQPKGIARIASTGGQPELIVGIDALKVVYGPQLLEEGRSVLYTLANLAGDDRWDTADIVVQQLGTEEKRVLLHGGSAGRLLPTGHLVYAVGATLFSVGVDRSTLQIKGGRVPVLEGVMRATNSATGAAQFVTSTTGVLAYVPGSADSTERQIARLDASSGLHPFPPPPRAYSHPRLSPDGKQIAVMTDDGKEAIIWIYDISGSGPPRRLTFGGRNLFPIWSPDGKTLAFQSDREGDLSIWRQRADGSGTAERLTRAERNDAHVPRSWTANGSTLAYTLQNTTHSAIWTIDTEGSKTPKLVVPDNKSAQTTPAFSPDGRWLAYGSNEGSPAAYYVYVQPYPPTGAKYQITTTATSTPVWSADGRRLYYAFTNQVFYADIKTENGFSFGQPTTVRTAGTYSSNPILRNFDVARDGSLIVLTRPDLEQRPQVTVVVNWFDELKQKVPLR